MQIKDSKHPSGSTATKDWRFLITSRIIYFLDLKLMLGVIPVTIFLCAYCHASGLAINSE